MKLNIEVTETKEIDLQYVRMSLPVRYGDDDIPYDFPMREGDTLHLLVDINNGEISLFPKEVKRNICMKVCDSGCYYLIDSNMEVFASMESEYVPSFFPEDHCGDYIEFKIENGAITNWKAPTDGDIEEFIAHA